MKDGPGIYLIEWTGTDDGRPMRFGTSINACSIDHAEKRSAELGARLVGRAYTPPRTSEGR